MGAHTFEKQGLCQKKKDLAKVAKCVLAINNLLTLASSSQSRTKAVVKFVRLTGLQIIAVIVSLFYLKHFYNQKYSHPSPTDCVSALRYSQGLLVSAIPNFSTQWF